ncbi:MAG: sn-glycerol-3-phosphate ABC transporter ATP-binding protein UgpC [Clostridia bacterium]|nr:sn-glycerol-3-phosphate ABC transporter ATP-binding protein UgpC [Clostridia bacterium]
MASVKLSHVYKIYPGGTKAVKDFCMSIEDKEFIVFVGPSGCGKSTTLRMIAGLEDITNGEIYIDGHMVNDVEPKDRDIAMVFQNYALYPHITVYENMAFGLKIRKVPNEEIHRRVLEAAEILGITEYLDRKPKAMSGGQRQRVALGRAIVREPKVFLFDEPLSNLDAKLRTQMRAEIRKLHARLNTTFIYVTHDKTEAMTMGTRIVVMKDGRIQQIDTPKNLYDHPSNHFVAGFIGSPQMNFYRARIDGTTGAVSLLHTETSFLCPPELLRKMKPEVRDGGRECIFGIRAEKIRLDDGEGSATAICTVSHAEELGDEILIYGDLGNESTTITERGTEIVLRTASDLDRVPLPGDKIKVAFDLSGAHFFDAETGENVCPRLPESNQLAVTVEGDTMYWEGIRFPLPPAIRIANGSYTAEIPISAVLPGKNGSLAVIRQEVVGERTLSHLKQSESILFADGAFGREGDYRGIAFDYRRITWKQNGQTVLAPLSERHVLYGSVLRRRVKENGNRKTEFHITVGDGEFLLPDNVMEELIKTAGTSILKKKLRYEIPPEALAVSERGIRATVTQYLDYGAYKYLRADASGLPVLSQTSAEVEGCICLAPDLTRITYISDIDDVILYN